MPTVVPPMAPNGPPTINPVAPGISKLSNYDPEAISMAKSSEFPIIDTVISRKAPAKTTIEVFTAVILLNDLPFNSYY